jgi:hypothetical protein
MVVDVVTFTLAEGVDEAAFLAADRRVQTELVPNQPGFLRRTTARRDGRWLVVTLWWSEAHAADFVAATLGDPIAQEFERLIDGVSSSRFDTLD